MANKRTKDLSLQATYDGDAFLHIDKDVWSEAKKIKASTILNAEASSRIAADNAIIAGSGLDAGGGYTPDPSTNYINAAGFISAGLTQNLKNADKLLDAQIAAMYSEFPMSFDIVISHSQILTIYSNPVTLVAAPGANKLILPVFVTAYYKYAGTQYSGDTDINVYSNNNGFRIVDTAFGYSTITILQNLGIDPEDISNVFNTSLYISTISYNPTGGTAGNYIRVIGKYYIIDFN